MDFSSLIAAFDNYPIITALVALGALLILANVAALAVRMLLGVVDGDALRDDGLDDGLERWERDLYADDEEKQDMARRAARRRRRK